MRYLHFYLFAAVGFCFANCLSGCSSGATNIPAATTTTQPVITPKAKFAYVGDEGASLSGYAVDPTSGALTPLNSFPFALGTNPTAVTHDPQNRFLIVADNAADSLHVFAIDSADGSLREVSPSPYNTKNETGSVVTDPSGTHVYLYVTGQNIAYPGQGGNQVQAYDLSATGVLTSVAGSPFYTGSAGISISGGTPAMTTDGAGKYLYVQDIQNLYVFSIDSGSGALTLLQTVPSKFGNAIALDPTGSYLYAVGSNSILTYGIDPASGLLTLVKSSPTASQTGPYTITLSHSGKFAYTIENNNDLQTYAVADGGFTPIGKTYSGIYGEQIAIDPSDSYLYVPQACSSCPSGVYNIVHEFSIGATGALTPLPSATVMAGVTPWGITITTQ